MKEYVEYKDYKIFLEDEVKVTNGVGTIVIDDGLLEFLNYIFEKRNK